MNRARRRLIHASVVRLCIGSALLSFGSCASPIDPADDRTCETILEAGTAFEAVDWFKSPSETPRQLGRMSNEASLALAYQFDAKGASQVMAVADERDRATGLIVVLPEAPGPRLEVFQLYAKATRNAGFSPRADEGQKYLFVAPPRAE